MPKRAALVSLVLAALALSACANTVRGVGQDVNETAEAVEDTLD